MGLIRKWSSDWLTPSSEATGTHMAAKGDMGEIIVATTAKKGKEKEAYKASKKDREAKKASTKEKGVQ